LSIGRGFGIIVLILILLYLLAKKKNMRLIVNLFKVVGRIFAYSMTLFFLVVGFGALILFDEEYAYERGGFYGLDILFIFPGIICLIWVVLDICVMIRNRKTK
jgi:hypothetical protein